MSGPHRIHRYWKRGNLYLAAPLHEAPPEAGEVSGSDAFHAAQQGANIRPCWCGCCLLTQERERRDLIAALSEAAYRAYQRGEARTLAEAAEAACERQPEFRAAVLAAARHLDDADADGEVYPVTA